MTELLVSSSALIAVLALLRTALKGRIPPGVQYGLWLLALVRLALPFALFSAPVSAAAAAAPVVRAAESVSAAAPGGLSPAVWLRWLWTLGSLCMGAWFCAVNIRLAAALRRSRRRYAFRGPIPVYVAAAPTPCLFGLLRPAVYLTEEAASDPDRACLVITHELTHRRHGDHVWAAVRALCLVVYWFDPFVWLAAHLSRRDGEIFCDAAAIRTLGEGRRYDYGAALLDLAAANAGPASLLAGASTMSGGARRLKERILLISRGRKRSAFLTAAVLLAAAVTAGFTFSGPAQAAAPDAPLRQVSPPLVTAAPALPPVTAPAETPQITPIPTPLPTGIPVVTTPPETSAPAANAPAPAGEPLVTAVPAEAYSPEARPAETEAPSGGGGASAQWLMGPESTAPAEREPDVTPTPPPVETPTDIPDRGSPPETGLYLPPDSEEQNAVEPLPTPTPPLLPTEE